MVELGNQRRSNLLGTRLLERSGRGRKE